MNIKTLLLIDDDNDFNTLVKFVLEQETDWEIIIASNGREGIAKAKIYRPNIILLDIVMPELNGLAIYKLLKKLDSHTCSTPIIFVTAMPIMKQVVRSQIAEDINIITKPFDILTLKNRIMDLYNAYLVTKK